jgi:hypothetical protein
MASDNTKGKNNKTLHVTAIPLRSIAAGELGRYPVIELNSPSTKVSSYFDPVSFSRC